MYLTVVIPAYNEEARIGPTLEHTIAYLSQKSYDWEIVVVNDGSRDDTMGVVRRVAGKHPVRLLDNEVNRGKGYSVTRGVLAAQGEFILFTDADESTPIAMLDRLLPALIDGYEVAIGSRAVDRSMVKEHQPFYREFMGRIFNLFVNAINVRGFQDTQCGFKMFRREAARDIFTRSRIDGFCFDVEAVFLAVHFGYKVKEIPVEWYNNPRSTVDPLKDSTKMFVDLLRIRYFQLKGLYQSRTHELPDNLSTPSTER